MASIPNMKVCILVVDDEPAILKLTKAILKRNHYSVVCSPSSKDALELFAARPFDFSIVITDLGMPQMPGDNLAKELNRIRPDVPIILTTGDSSRIDEETAKAVGIRACLEKPISKQHLLTTIREILEEAHRSDHKLKP